MDAVRKVNQRVRCPRCDCAVLVPTAAIPVAQVAMKPVMVDDVEILEPLPPRRSGRRVQRREELVEMELVMPGTGIGMKAPVTQQAAQTMLSVFFGVIISILSVVGPRLLKALILRR